ncbi:MAG: hypothetical protein HY926_04540 [Elusimicrobia bacterium]|nr:hypothetical protein [Elusimicrobiota bacterium]
MDDKHTHDVDLFGLKKDAEAPPAAAGEAEAPRSGRSRPKLWGFLLVVDSILVIVFGGALAAQLYQHLWAAPTPVVAAARRTPKPVPPPAPPAEAPKPVEAPAPAAPSGSGERQPSRDGGPSAAGPKAAKPSWLAEPPRGREAAKPQAPGAAKPSAAAPAPIAAGEKPRSVPVEFKLKASHAKTVQLAGAFIVRGGRKDMAEHEPGHWSLTLYLLPGTSYRYWFLVDGKKTLDPENSQVERGASVLVLP